MKTKIFTLLALTALFCTSCSKDDFHVEVEDVVGEWLLEDGRLQDSFHIAAKYIFNEDGTFLNTCYLDGFTGTYSLNGKASRILTLFDENGEVRSQYYIREIDAKEIKLQDTDKNAEIKNILLFR